MTVTWGRNVIAVVVGAVLMASSQASAEDKVEVKTQVVLASNNGAQVDAGLEGVKADLAKDKKVFSSLKSLSKKDVTLQQGKEADLAMPDGRKVTLKLTELKGGVATVAVTIFEGQKQFGQATYTLAKGKSAVIATGTHQGGVLLLVLSPPGGAQPRVAPMSLRPGPRDVRLLERPAPALTLQPAP